MLVGAVWSAVCGLWSVVGCPWSRNLESIANCYRLNFAASDFKRSARMDGHSAEGVRLIKSRKQKAESGNVRRDA